MTDEEVFQKLLTWAMTFGCDVFGGEREENEQRRGQFRVLKRVPGRYDEEMEIVIQTDLPLNEKLDILAHEIGHMALYLLKLNPDQKVVREPLADLLGRCLVAALREEWQNPVFKITGIAELAKEFLQFVKAKQERTCLNLSRMEQEYFRWKREMEAKGSGKQEGGMGG